VELLKTRLARGKKKGSEGKKWTCGRRAKAVIITRKSNTNGLLSKTSSGLRRVYGRTPRKANRGAIIEESSNCRRRKRRRSPHQIRKGSPSSIKRRNKKRRTNTKTGRGAGRKTRERFSLSREASDCSCRKSLILPDRLVGQEYCSRRITKRRWRVKSLSRPGSANTLDETGGGTGGNLQLREIEPRSAGRVGRDVSEELNSRPLAALIANCGKYVLRGWGDVGYWDIREGLLNVLSSPMNPLIENDSLCRLQTPGRRGKKTKVSCKPYLARPGIDSY